MMTATRRDYRRMHDSTGHGKAHAALRREWKRDVRGTFAKAAQKRSIEVMVSSIEFAIGIVDGARGTQVLKDVIQVFYSSYGSDFLQSIGWWPEGAIGSEAGNIDLDGDVLGSTYPLCSTRVDSIPDDKCAEVYRSARAEFVAQGRVVARRSMIKSIQHAIGICMDRRVPDAARKVLDLCYTYDFAGNDDDDADASDANEDHDNAGDDSQDPYNAARNTLGELLRDEQVGSEDLICQTRDRTAHNEPFPSKDDSGMGRQAEAPLEEHCITMSPKRKNLDGKLAYEDEPILHVLMQVRCDLGYEGQERMGKRAKGRTINGLYKSKQSLDSREDSRTTQQPRSGPHPVEASPPGGTILLRTPPGPTASGGMV